MSDESDRTESPQPDDPEAESRWITWPSAAAPPHPGPGGAHAATPAQVLENHLEELRQTVVQLGGSVGHPV
ncbi:hypothetical protein [Nocardia cyriacigeorgica]|uniref:hypothetical protein n=1 Tax=Nocardia cyriacigeorgica TaxID=135487 RepID=UPI002457AA6B|nr:hypothetical protein [Nocardia cyriacigeorgica]